MRVGIDSLDEPPQNDEEADEQLVIKRCTVQTLVERVQVSKDRELQVTFKLNVLAAIKHLVNFSQPMSVGICTHIPDETRFARVLAPGGKFGLQPDLPTV